MVQQDFSTRFVAFFFGPQHDVLDVLANVETAALTVVVKVAGVLLSRACGALSALH